MFWVLKRNLNEAFASTLNISFDSELNIFLTADMLCIYIQYLDQIF